MMGVEEGTVWYPPRNQPIKLKVRSGVLIDRPQRAHEESVWYYVYEKYYL